MKIVRMVIALCTAISLAACASGQNDEAVADFKQLLIEEYEFSEDNDIVEAYMPGGVPQADLLLEYDTCRVEVAGYADSPDDEDTDLEVRILRVGEWWEPPGAPGNLVLMKDPQDREEQISGLCAAYSPPSWT